MSCGGVVDHGSFCADQMHGAIELRIIEISMTGSRSNWAVNSVIWSLNAREFAASKHLVLLVEVCQRQLFLVLDVESDSWYSLLEQVRSSLMQSDDGNNQQCT